MVQKKVAFKANGKRVSFLAKKKKPKKAAPCSQYPVGAVITRKTSNGWTVKLKKIRSKKLCWRIVSNKKTRKSST